MEVPRQYGQTRHLANSPLANYGNTLSPLHFSSGFAPQ